MIVISGKSTDATLLKLEKLMKYSEAFDEVMN